MDRLQEGEIRGPGLTTQVRAAIWQAHGRRCAYTGELVTFDRLEIDHLIPLATPTAEIDRLIEGGIIDVDFDLNGFGNLLPTSAFQNNRKRAHLRSDGTLRHFLEMASQFRSAVEARVAAEVDDNQRLSAYLKLKIKAEANDLKVDDIIDISRQQAEGITRLRHSLEILDADEISLANAQNALELMKKPFALGGGSISEVIVQDDADNETVCRTCDEFLAAKDRGLWPMTQYAINVFSMADRTCETLRMIQRSAYAPVSRIRYPRVTCKTLDRWSSAWALSAWMEFDQEDGPLFAGCSTLSELAAAGGCMIEEASDWNVVVHPRKGLSLSLSELFRADLDQDGEEEILVFDLVFAQGGTLRAGSVRIGKADANGIIQPVNLEPAAQGPDHPDGHSALLEAL